MIKLLISIFIALVLTTTSHAAVIELEINFDDFAFDISWEVRDTSSAILYSHPSYDQSLDNTTIIESFALSMGTYFFEIFDSHGDGLCCNEGPGSYELRQGSTSLYTSNGQFGSGETVEFDVAGVSVPEPATMALMGLGLLGLGWTRRKAS